MKKSVIYLFGAGASHAVVSKINAEKGLLTGHIRDQIRSNYKPSIKIIDNKIWNEVIDEEVDIEHLISVIESHYNYWTTEKLRELYRNAIRSICSNFKRNLPKNLYTVLIDLYNIESYNEEIDCLITLNYEDILERTIVKHFNYSVSYGIQGAEIKPHNAPNGKKYKIIKLHGSFNWVNRRPIAVRDISLIKSKEALWIPPGVEKRKEDYPFNLLWGGALECLMHCDILRIIGCSLSRNDWGLIPLLYTAQTFSASRRELIIEIIDYPETFEKIRRAYPYLNFQGLYDIPDFLEYFKANFARSSPQSLQEEMRNYLSKDRVNIFEMYLEAKIEALAKREELSIRTPMGYLHNFYYKD